MELEILKTLVILFGLSAFVVFVLHKLRVPSIVGFLIAGIFLGPHGIVSHSIKDLEIRTKTGATVIAVRRDGEVIPSLEPEFIFKPGDVLYLIGKRENILKVIEWLEPVED